MVSLASSRMEGMGEGIVMRSRSSAIMQAFGASERLCDLAINRAFAKPRCNASRFICVSLSRTDVPTKSSRLRLQVTLKGLDGKLDPQPSRTGKSR